MTLQRGHGSGFTLFEMMLAIAVGSIVLLAAASALGSYGDGCERIGGGMAVEREARAAITQLRCDLSTAVFHKDGVMETSAGVWPSDRIGFLSLQPADAQSAGGRVGDLCAVNYYLKDLTIRGRKVRCLMRGFRESADAFKALGSDSVSTLFNSRSSMDEPVAFGVLSFVARPKSRDASGQWIDWIRNEDSGPEALDVRLVFVRRGLLARLKQSDDWHDRRALGLPSDAGQNQDLETCEAMFRFGSHENP